VSASWGFVFNKKMQRIKDPKIKTLDKKEHLNMHTRKKSIHQSRTERKVLTLVEERERERERKYRQEREGQTRL
jgi:hypothetical protein